MNSAVRFVLLPVAACALVSVFAADASGRQEVRRSGNTAEAERLERERRFREMREADLSEREYMLRHLTPEPPISERPSARLALAQLKEDFARIQVLNNDLLKAASNRDALDLKLVSKSAAEIKRRATRLRDNLALPEPEKREAHDAAKAEQPAELVPALSALDHLIIKFVDGVVSNGVYRVDAQSSATARQDLESIIELSEHVKKESERLGKSPR